MTTNTEVQFTHVGIHVQHLEEAAQFYREVLGLVETDRGTLGDQEFIFLSASPTEHHQVILVSGLTAPPLEPVINQLSFRIADLPALLAFHARVRGIGVRDLQPINHGNAWSVYFRDPEGNRIEVYTPSPWYILQPCRVPLAIDQPAEVIWQETQDWCRLQPGFAAATDFHARIAARIRAIREQSTRERSE